MRFVVFACLAVLVLPTVVQAVEPCAVVPELWLNATDANRLDQLLESRQNAITQVEKGGDSEALATLRSFYGSPPIAADDIAPGEYRCRTVKLGGNFGVFTAYGFFKCKVTKSRTGLRLEKTSGSQRFSGELIDVGGGLVFRGADHYGDEEPRAYDALPDRNSVACLSRVGDKSGAYILEFPLPFLESAHDVIELRK